MRRIDEIATFVQVVEAGGISQAAKRLDMSKSSVSKRVSDLEDSLGTQLLYRSSRRVVPTERGLVFYERARAILQQLDEAAEALSEKADDLAGLVRIAAPMSFGILHLGPLLLPLMERHPKLEIAIDLDDRSVDIQGLGYDLAIRIGRLADSTLIARRLATVRPVLCCSPAYAERFGLPKTVADLNRHDGLGYGNLRTAEAWQFEPKDGGPVQTASPKSRFVSNNGDLIAQAAAAGLGVAILPSFILCEFLRAGKLLEIELDAMPIKSALHAVYPPSRHRSRKVRAIIDHLAAAIPDPPSWDRR
ncbi:MAG TPA: LysR substrate-binding domain-containing protein [Alphaproteobacteria bacterium]|nr:LysR substrate-binding domain-containing protein [Alphaproteobacteria bacterium]